jgi:hypothetical protein
MRYPHWQFFESVDDELYGLSRVIDFDPKNYSTFSVDLSRLYLSICSEIDVVAKLLCYRIDSCTSAKNINEYRALITGKYKYFSAFRIEMPSYGLDFEPWASWSSGTNPTWWDGYNRVKRERSRHFSDANLGNVLRSAAGLLGVLVYYYQPLALGVFVHRIRFRISEGLIDFPIYPDFRTMRSTIKNNPRLALTERPCNLRP